MRQCNFDLDQRDGSPAADLNKTRLRKITFSTEWPPRTSADCEASPKHSEGEGGQVKPVLDGNLFSASAYTNLNTIGLKYGISQITHTTILNLWKLTISFSFFLSSTMVAHTA